MSSRAIETTLISNIGRRVNLELHDGGNIIGAIREMRRQDMRLDLELQDGSMREVPISDIVGVRIEPGS